MEQNISIAKRIKALEKALRDPDEDVRQKAAESLSLIETIADFDTYVSMLDSDDKVTKIQAIHLLAELATEAAIQVLQPQAGDPCDDVRAAVIQALGNNSDNYSTREIREKAVDIAIMGLEDTNLSVRAFAADTLAKFKDPRAVDALLTVITSRTEETAGESEDVGSPTARKKKEEDVLPVVSALLALGEIEDRKVAPEIIKKAKDDNLEVRKAALKALGILDDPRGEDCLIEALASGNARIRMQAAESLGNIKREA